MAAPDKLSLYNGALRVLRETRIASLTEERPARYLLDDVWNDEPIETCLEMGLWNFAIKTIKISEDPDETMDFGFRYAFSKPTDWVRTAALSSDEYFTNPLVNYADETNFWYADIDPIFVRFVSNHADYGLNYELWTRLFRVYVHHYLANEIVGVHSTDDEFIKLVAVKTKDALKEAKNKDAMNDPPAFPPAGRWVRSRYSQSGTTNDRGNTRSLIG